MDIIVPGCLHDEFAGTYQSLFISQCHILASLDRGHGRPDSHHSNDRCKNDVSFRIFSGLNESLHSRTYLDLVQDLRAALLKFCF